MTYDLVIKNVKVFNTKQGFTPCNKTILINADKIVKVINNNQLLKVRKVIDAGDKLVTPGIIYAHIPPTHFFLEYDEAPKYLAKDSLDFLRKKGSDNYHHYGDNAVTIMGQSKTWLKSIPNWSAAPYPNYTNVYTAGGALISNEESTPYLAHLKLESRLAAMQKIIAYYNLAQGI